MCLSVQGQGPHFKFTGHTGCQQLLLPRPVPQQLQHRVQLLAALQPSPSPILRFCTTGQLSMNMGDQFLLMYTLPSCRSRRSWRQTPSSSPAELPQLQLPGLQQPGLHTEDTMSSEPQNPVAQTWGWTTCSTPLSVLLLIRTEHQE